MGTQAASNIGVYWQVWVVPAFVQAVDPAAAHEAELKGSHPYSPGATHCEERGAWEQQVLVLFAGKRYVICLTKAFFPHAHTCSRAAL